MPLVRIDVRDTVDDGTLLALGEAVHQAMTETIDVPADDRFQVLSRHPEPGLRYDPQYLGIERDDGIVFIAITLRAGRTQAQKVALYQRIVELAQKQAGIDPRNVLITLTENTLEDWSFGEGVAQMIT